MHGACLINMRYICITFSPGITCSFKKTFVLASSSLAFSEIGNKSVMGAGEFFTTTSLKGTIVFLFLFVNT